MAYASLTDLERRLGAAAMVQLTDDEGTGEPDVERAQEALAGSEGEVESYLARRYAVPVSASEGSSLAAVLRSVVLDLAEHRLYARRPTMPDSVRLRREAAVSWLERIASGRAELPSAGELAGNAARGVLGEAAGVARVLSRKELEGL